MRYVNYPSDGSVDVYTYCDRFFCQDCLTEVDNKYYGYSYTKKVFTENVKAEGDSTNVNIVNNNSVFFSNVLEQGNNGRYTVTSRKGRIVAFLLRVSLSGLGIGIQTLFLSDEFSKRVRTDAYRKHICA